MQIDFVTIAVHLINVVILFFFLRWLLYKPVKKFLDARSASFDERREDLARQEEDLAKRIADYESSIASSKQEADGIIREARNNANKRAEKIIDEARDSAKEILAATRTEIAAERETAQARMREEVADLAVVIAARVLEREVKKDDNERIIENFFERERIG
jgi:F-type H+-transporting ATPase subunit b